MAEAAGRRRVRVGTAAMVLLAFAVGVGTTVLLTRDDGDGAPPAASGPAPGPPVVPAGEAPPRTRTADSAEAAVRGFLDAEMAKDYEGSFNFLSDADRAAFGTTAGYVAAHADLVPPVLGYEIAEATPTAVVATVHYQPSLDPVAGLVPGEARVTWAVTGGPGGFGLDLDASTIEPVFPSDDAAPAAVQTWAESRRRCDLAPEWDGGLLGSPALAEPLCGAQGPVAVGPTGRLGPTEGVPFFAAFGEESAEWARVVPVTSPGPLRAVVAPIGPDWVVIGVLSAGPGAGL